MKIFLAGGESRHWIQDELLEFQKKKNELRRSNAVIPRRCMALAEWGGMTKLLRNIARTFWNHSFMLTRTRSD